MTRYAAFLRGINVGGNRIIKMADLRAAFEGIGFKNVRTILASGNVLFEAGAGRVETMAARIEAELKQRFNSEIGVVVRTVAELESLKEAEPFMGVEVTPDKRLYVSFLRGKMKSGVKLPDSSAGGDFRILRITDQDVCSVVDLGKSGTTDLMDVLDKTYGRQITTRSWNTIVKMLVQT